MLYGYGMKLGVHLLLRAQIERALRHLIIPVGYWRVAEYALVLNNAAFRSTDRILDIGSPKPLSLYLAKKLGAEVFSTDINDYFVREYTTLRDAEHVPAERFHLAIEDGRQLSFADESFDKVYAISVVEHISDHGDSACLREIGRVLAPGGRCLITVPAACTSRDIYKRASTFYWAQSSKQADDGLVFFQRRYSKEDLFERLIKPSGLTLRKLQFVGERVLANSSRELAEVIPQTVQIATGPLHPLLSKIFHTKAVDSWQDVRKPLCALLVLEKPE